MNFARPGAAERAFFAVFQGAEDAERGIFIVNFPLSFAKVRKCSTLKC